MIEFDKREVNAQYFEEFYKRESFYIEYSVSRDLIGKTEAGSTRSERGYQLVAAGISGSIARAIGGNEDKAKWLSMMVGMYFPKYGQEGIKAVKQYIMDHDIDLELETLGSTTICYNLSHHIRNVHIIPAFIYDLLHDYFGGVDSCEEIEIVRLVQATIMDIKKAENFYDGDPGKLLFDVMQELVDLAVEYKMLMKSTLLEKFSKQIADYQFPSLTNQERQEIYDGLDEYIRGFTHHQGELAKYNKTPEEAVLMYIYSAV